MRHLSTSKRASLRGAILVLTAAVAAAAGTAASLLAPSLTYAGTWGQTACQDVSGRLAPSEGWYGLSGGGVSIGSTNEVDCAGSRGMFASLSANAQVPVGAYEGIAYAPPEGSTLAGGELQADLVADGTGYLARGLAAVYTPDFVYDGSNVVIQCSGGVGPCGSPYPNQYRGVVTIPNRGGKLFAVASCGGTAGGRCNADRSDNVWARVRVYSARLLLSSSASPTASDFRGSLLTADAHGTASFGYTASVPTGPGIYRSTVMIDSRIVYDATPNTNGGACVATTFQGVLWFTSQQPCPRSTAVDLNLSTTGLRDGEHELKVLVMDAAQNTQTVLRRTITTTNRTTPSSTLTSNTPGAGTATPGAPGATDPLYSNVLDPATQKLQRGVRRRWRHSAIAFSGTLRSSAGLPAPGVAVVLLAQNAGVGEWALISRTVTDAAGHWELKAPRGPSRILAIAAGLNASPMGSAVVRIRQVVTPALSLRVRALGRARLSFRGRLQITPLGSPRPLVIIQARGKHGWQAVPGSPIRVDHSGAYRLLVYVDRKRGVGRRYTFRAVAPATPLAATATSPVRAAVAR